MCEAEEEERKNGSTLDMASGFLDEAETSLEKKGGEGGSDPETVHYKKRGK